MIGFSRLSLKTTCGWFSGLGLKTQVRFQRESKAACGILAKLVLRPKLSHKGRVSIGLAEFELDHNPLGLGGSLQIFRALFKYVIGSIKNRRLPNQFLTVQFSFHPLGFSLPYQVPNFGHCYATKNILELNSAT